jgi:hypothetical protein
MELTVSEIFNLSTSYLVNTMTSVVTADFLKKAESSELKKMLKFALKIANEEVKGAESFLRNDNRVLPEPFSEKDILKSDSKYYSDNFVVLLKYRLGQDALNLYNLNFTTAINSEVKQFYKKILSETVELMDMCADLLIKMGLHKPLIHIPRNEIADKVDEQSFLGNLFGENRPLSVPEVFQLTSNYLSTEVFRELLRSFSTTKKPELREHFERGKKICSKHLETIQEKLDKDELPQLPTWESEIDTDEGPPFSDRLMLFKISLVVGATGGRYGVSASGTLRKDLGLSFLKMMGETLLFAEDTGNLLIKYKMLDKPPLVKKSE